MKKVICSLWTLASLIISQGCSGPWIRYDLSSFKETLQANQPISPGYSRIIMYGTHPPIVTIENQNYFFRYVFPFVGQSATYLDVPSGTYSIYTGKFYYKQYIGRIGDPLPEWMPSAEAKININTEPSKTYYIKVTFEEITQHCCLSGETLNTILGTGLDFSKNYGSQKEIYSENTYQRMFLGLITWIPKISEEPLGKQEIEKDNFLGDLHKPILTVVPKKEYSLSESDKPPANIETKGLAKLYVIRSTGFLGCGVSLKIGFDSKTRYRLDNDRYCCFYASEGQHTFTFYPSEGLGEDVNFTEGCIVNLKKNEDTYILINQGKYVLWTPQELSIEEGQKLINRKKINKNGYLLVNP